MSGGCTAPQIACGGACVNGATDNNNCGVCGSRCDAATQACSQGRCQPLCPNGQRRCGSACVNLTQDQANCGACNNRCAPGTLCSDGACEVGCGAGLTACEQPAEGDASVATVCVNTERDPSNCGGCGNRCREGTVCRAGVCRAECPAGQLVCGDRCVDPRTDNNNCGACRAACMTNYTCVEARCRLGDCPAGSMQCSARCVDVRNDRFNCGGCSIVCGPGQVCSMGVCATGCAPGQTICGNFDAGVTSCADTMVDRANCGMCGRACPAGQVCTAGACVTECQMGQMLCDGRCVDPSSDRAHCGACGTACPGSQLCVGGSCMAMCPPGLSLCGTTCINLQVDPANCARCGNACPAGQVCGAGVCRPLAMVDGGCAPPSLLCGATCTNTQGDNNHCGRCGNACTADRICAAGMCVAPCPTGQDRCGAACTMIQTDRTNCGACGNACPGTLPCLAGTCSCPMGQTNCSNACVDTQNDGMNCGACGTRCAAGLFCVRGVCGMAPPVRYMRVASPPTMPFVRACGMPGATTLLAGADDGAMLVPLAFPFRYWAVDLSMGAMINVSSNGFISLDGVLNSSLGGTIPSASTPNATIAAYWGDDYNRGPQCVVTVGAAPNRRMVFQWDDTTHCCGDDPAVHLTYEIILNEARTIDVLYDRMDGARAQTLGIENQTGTMFVTGCPTGTTTTCVPTAGLHVSYTPIP